MPIQTIKAIMQDIKLNILFEVFDFKISIDIANDNTPRILVYKNKSCSNEESIFIIGMFSSLFSYNFAMGIIKPPSDIFSNAVRIKNPILMIGSKNFISHPIS